MSLPQVKQGLKFNGLTDYVQINQPIVGFGLTGGYEIDFTLLQPANGTFLFGSGANTRTYLTINTSNGTFLATKGNPGVGINSVASVLDGKRHTASVFWLNGTFYLYVDGVLQGSAAFTDTSDGTQCRIAGQTFADGYCNMKVHAFRQYSRALSDTEITTNYNGHVTRNGLVGEWLLNEGTGTVATDTSGNGNNGTINGATWLIKKAPVKPKKNYFDGVLESGALDNTNGSTIVNSAFIRSKNFVQVESSKQYTFSKARFVQFYDINKVWISSSAGLNDLASPSTVTTPSNCYYIKFHITGTDTATLVQIEQGAVSTSFEPYQLLTANKPMPQKPKKNMLPPFTDSAWTLHPNAVIVNPTSLLLNATNQSQESRITVPVIPGQTYTVSSTNGSDGSHRLYVFKNDLVTAYGSPLTSGYSSFTFTPTENTVVIKLYNFPAATGTFTFTNPQLELGSVATSFENYKLISDVKILPLVPKKNMFDGVIDSGSLNGSGVETSSSLFYRGRNYIGVVPNTSYIAKDNTYSSSEMYINYFDVNKTHISQSVNIAPGGLFTAPSNAYYIRVCCMPIGAFRLDARLQIELGSVATPFESYKLVPDVKHI